MSLTTVKICPLTGQAAKFYCRKEGVDYYINALDQVIFLGNMPSPDVMLKYADNHYETGVYQDYVKAKALKILTANIRLKQIAQYAPGKKMLDIGCSAGFFIEAAQAHGYDVQGVEFSAVAIAQAAPSVQDKIIQGDAHQELGRFQNDIDWISAFDIIEHMHDPVNFLVGVKNSLKPGGFLVMSTPDTGHFLRRLMGASWPMLQPLQHTVLFSRSAMKKVLEAQGFVDIKIKPTYKYMSLEYLTQQLCETNKFISAMMQLMLKIIPNALTKHAFRINIGEFIVFAKKPSFQKA